MGSPSSCSRILVPLCGLVPDCGTAFGRRSCRDRHGFGGSLPIAWLHPTLAGVKLVISAVFHHISLFVPTAMKIGPLTVGPYHLVLDFRFPQ
jgi:hypothetical protein